MELKRSDRRSQKVVKKRSRNGCLSCKRLKIKCSEGKPACEYCVETGRECIYLNRSSSGNATAAASTGSITSEYVSSRLSDSPFTPSPSSGQCLEFPETVPTSGSVDDAMLELELELDLSPLNSLDLQPLDMTLVGLLDSDCDPRDEPRVSRSDNAADINSVLSLKKRYQSVKLSTSALLFSTGDLYKMSSADLFYFHFFVEHVSARLALGSIDACDAWSKIVVTLSMGDTVLKDMTVAISSQFHHFVRNESIPSFDGTMVNLDHYFGNALGSYITIVERSKEAESQKTHAIVLTSIMFLVLCLISPRLVPLIGRPGEIDLIGLCKGSLALESGPFVKDHEVEGILGSIYMLGRIPVDHGNELVGIFVEILQLYEAVEVLLDKGEIVLWESTVYKSQIENIITFYKEACYLKRPFNYLSIFKSLSPEFVCLCRLNRPFARLIAANIMITAFLTQTNSAGKFLISRHSPVISNKWVNELVICESICPESMKIYIERLYNMMWTTLDALQTIGYDDELESPYFQLLREHEMGTAVQTWRRLTIAT